MPTKVISGDDPFAIFGPILDPEIQEFASERYDLREENRRISQAMSKGMAVIRGGKNTLLFDLDTEEALTVFRLRSQILEAKGFSPHIVITRSEHGNYHAVVTVTRDMTEGIRLAIQACLGSDWKREFLGVLRNLNKQESVSLLFQPQPPVVVP